MRKCILILTFFFAAKQYSQISIPATSTFQCNDWGNVYFMVNQGSGPFTYTIYPPSSCAPLANYTLSSALSPCSFSMSCPGTYTINVEDGSSTPVGTATCNIAFATHINSGILGSSSNDTICLTQINTLFAQYPQTYILNSISWNTGETTETINVSPAATTTYSFSGVIYSALYSRSCTASGTTTIHVIDCGFYAGMPENAIEKLKFFPNPSNGRLHIDFESTVIDKISISNVLGQEVYKLLMPSVKQEIDISQLPTGIYFIRAENKHVQGVFKIVKE